MSVAPKVNYSLLVSGIYFVLFQTVLRRKSLHNKQNGAGLLDSEPASRAALVQ